MKTISLLNPADLPLAWEIEKLSHSFPWSEETFYSNQGSHYFNLKICIDNIIVGFAITQLILDEATLFNIAIHPDYQGKGYGKALLLELIETLEKKNITTLWLEVRESNEKAFNLYESIGFNFVSKRKNYYPTKTGNEDAIIMAYPISF
ncbi:MULTISPECIES: ribosomal protein S18-alanine N-acetyltransferase [Proteus]|uniref:[Ribosomal protein bS18]-alanine N-acetyltransferase n=2 Tax=Proteus TaxID=583 RepID=A0AAW7CQU2_9GAMM|nr:MULTISPECIES: ribosomal protein S18-alanine N-acetyltransferase [Proteus]MBG3014042.1 ribosomal protein S18-alanine N-acetyltransferase [Proteus mirabilis]MDO5405075.1 ribosomal protein S18-alanine N-acetyltransferase [Proteus sp. (in: enterobacteria)]QNH65288.1 ribosomal protein S18-alanine N-acetyltransferase [Proteus vulgaris]MBJ2118529.1 ribosomal protein S18-alanine N-acetyltransferase [Proteus penneri]MCO8052453.1 ribosomal protein S18-alanine N-acetyltransferase [Proteus penneri]